MQAPIITALFAGIATVIGVVLSTKRVKPRRSGRGYKRGIIVCLQKTK